MNKVRARRKAGTAGIELIAGVVILVPIALYGINIVTVMATQSALDSVCIEAARSAATGSPARINSKHTREVVDESSGPFARAHATASTFRRLHPTFVQTELKVIETVNEPLPAAPLGGAVQGEVAVELETRAKMPVQLPGFGEAITVKSRKNSPFTWVMQPVMPP